MFADRTMKMYAQLGKKYGVDYVNLGFFSGAESGLAAWAENFPNIFKTDWLGVPIAQFPMMKDIKSVKDFDLVLTFNNGPGTGLPEMWSGSA